MVVRGHPSLSLTRQCRLLSIGRSSLYDRPKGESAETLALMRRIDALFLKYPFYGARQMVRHLRREGVRIGRRRAARLMRLLGLQAVYRAPRTSAPHLGHRVYPYLLRGLAIERPNHVWCADITYIPVRRGFLYLVAIMDWASRCVLAWRLSNTLDAGFCVEALDEALARHGTPQIFNTDQGSQFTGFAFTARLREAGIRISMDGRGRCMDNIFIERLWRSLKYEAVYLHEIADGFAARRVIGQWIGFYNTERPHSALGGRTPAEAYRGDTPVDMMDKPLRALTTYPQAQQQQQKDRSKRILAAQTSTGIHLENAVSLSDKPTPPHRTKPFLQTLDRLPIYSSRSPVCLHMLEGFPDFPLCYRERLCPCHPAPPVTSWPTAAAEHHSPFGPAPLQRLHPYYGLFCPCAPHRYSEPSGGCPVGRLPWHRDDRFSCSARKPVPGSRRLRAGCRVGRTPGLRPCLSRSDHHPRF